MNEAASAAATILNVDDNEGSLYVKTRVLRRAGFQVIEADRGSSVMPLLNTHQPDLVLLDVNLPDGNGIEICRAIKSDPNHASTIVVQISASFVAREDRLRGLAAGADSYFTEPMEPEELVANVHALLRIRQMEKQLRRSAIEWQKTFDAVHDGVAIVQETGIITRCNPAFEKLTGQQAVGRAIDDVLRTHIALSGGSAVELELHDRVLRLSIDSVFDQQGQVTHFACILSDATAERDLKRAKEAVDAASRSKDDFLAVVSHELRTPMTSIIGWAQMLQIFEHSPESMRQAIDAILSAAKAQSQLVDDLLDLSRITTGKLRLEIETLDFAEVVEDALQTIVPAAAAKRISIQRHVEPVKIRGDRNRLQQVVWNLLSNAMKFTPDGGSVDIDVEVNGTRAILSVHDTGRGIDPDFLDSVFDRFSQGEDARRAGRGLGLGLAIVRHIVELHGGEVTAESEGRGKGATFRVMLPIA